MYRFKIIEKVEIVRETDSYVVVMTSGGVEVRQNKRSKFNNFFDTFQEAKDFLALEIIAKNESLEKQITYNDERLKKIEALREENETTNER